DSGSALRHTVAILPRPGHHRAPHSFPTRRSSDLSPGDQARKQQGRLMEGGPRRTIIDAFTLPPRSRRSDLLVAAGCANSVDVDRSEEHTSELQSRGHLVCRLLLEKKNVRTRRTTL